MSPETPGTTGKAAKALGLQRLKGLQIIGGEEKLEDSAEIREAIGADLASMQTLDTEVDVEKTMDEALEDLESNLGTRTHPIGNGTTVPFPDEGEDTTDHSTCRKPIPNVNRGCMHYGGRCRLPMLAAKYGEPGGPYNVRYKDLRTGVVKTCFCTTFASTYLKVPNIVLIPPSAEDPPGETWVPTRMAERTPFPNGQMPVPGVGQPTTPIRHTARKTRLICVPSPRVTREYQQMRRRGDFDRKPKRERARRR